MLDKIVAKFGGIRYIYPLTPLPIKTKAFVALTRPLTAIGGFVAGMALTLFASLYFHASFSIFTAILVGFCLSILHGAAQALNQCLTEEIEIDRINKPYRPLVQGIITQGEAQFFVAVLFAIALAIAWFIKPIFVIWIGVIMFFSIFYTMPPLRVKRYFILSNVWQGIARGYLPVVGVFSIYNSHFSLFASAFGFVVGMWITGGQASKDVGDIEGDRKYGIHTLFTVMSLDDALDSMLVTMVASFFFLLLFICIDILPLSFTLLLVLIVPSYAIVHVMDRSTRLAENNYGWLIFYSTLALWYLLPALILTIF